jgi:hypothetical protein
MGRLARGKPRALYPEGNQKLSLPEWNRVVVRLAPAERQRYRVRTT